MIVFDHPKKKCNPYGFSEPRSRARESTGNYNRHKHQKKIGYLNLDGDLYMDANHKDNSWGTIKVDLNATTNLDKNLNVSSTEQISINIV